MILGMVADVYGLGAADLARILRAPYTFSLTDRSIKGLVMAEFKRMQAVGLDVTGAAPRGKPASITSPRALSRHAPSQPTTSAAQVSCSVPAYSFTGCEALVVCVGGGIPG